MGISAMKCFEDQELPCPVLQIQVNDYPDWRRITSIYCSVGSYDMMQSAREFLKETAWQVINSQIAQLFPKSYSWCQYF